jgi:hypothetical protein
MAVRAALYLQEDSWYSLLLKIESITRAVVRLEELGKLKNSMTLSGIEAATFRLVARCLNKLRYRVPPM